MDISQQRLSAIRVGAVDLSATDRQRLGEAIADPAFTLTCRHTALAEADTVIICVPTPVDRDRVPDLSALRAACDAVVNHAHDGQTIVLSSTSYVGTTRDLLATPLLKRGFEAGSDVFVAFSPERIDPGNPDHSQRKTPRVVGGITTGCGHRAAQVVSQLTDSVFLVNSPEAAELTKLYENTFRAVTLALANEFADACRTLSLDPIEVTLAAATKPYGFLGAFPGPGVGGHCIPCDPHYLLWQLRQQNCESPLIQQAMASIEARPHRVVSRVRQMLDEVGRPLRGSRLLLVGVSYKAGVRDLRESPAIPIITELLDGGADVRYHDPLIPELHIGDKSLHSEQDPRGDAWDLAVIHTIHPGFDYSWAYRCPRILDATYQFDGPDSREVV